MERSKVHTKMTKVVYHMELEPWLFLEFVAFQNKNYTAYDRFQINGRHSKILTKKEPNYHNACIYLKTTLPQEEKPAGQATPHP